MDAKADLSPRWAHIHFVGFVMSRLICYTGATLATINIAGAQSQDWEDIACGPCAGGSGHCIYIADTGGNAGGLSNTIYRIREPDVIKSQTVPAESALMFR